MSQWRNRLLIKGSRFLILEKGKEVSNTMRKKIAYALAVSAVSVMTFSAPAFGHDAGPCTPSEEEPGHSEYAQHHVKPAVPESGHNPGEHQGFSVCNPSGR